MTAAFAYPGRRILAATWSRYSPKSAGRWPAYSFGRYDFQETAAQGGAMAARSKSRRSVLVLPFRTNGPTSTRPEISPGALRGGEHRSTCAHRVAHHDRGTAEYLDQGDDIASCLLIAVRRERGIAVAVAAKIGAGHPVTRSP